MAGMQTIREGLTGNITKLIVVAIVITFVGSIGWAGFFSQGNANIIAKIGSKQITNVDLGFEASSQQFQLNQRFPNQQIEEEVLVEISIESLIRKFGVLNFIEDNDLYLPDSFILQELAKNEQFQENGRFNRQIFDSYARSNGFIPQDYMNRIKQDLALEFWRQSLLQSSFLSEEEVQRALILAEQERDITFIRIPLSKFSKEVKVSENSLLDFYKTNISEYFTESKARVNYISLSAKDLETSIAIDDSDIETEYLIYLEEFDRTERKSVSHIMVNIDSNRTKEEAIEILENTKERLSKGESFNSLVIEISDDEGTRDSGGSLGITDGTLLPPEFEKALLNMVEEEVYGPIELNNSVHLIQLTEREIPKPKSLENMQSQIRENLSSEYALDAYVELLDKASDLVFSMGSLEAISKELAINSTDSGFFSLNQASNELNTPSVLDIIFDPNLDSNLIELVEISDQSALLIERIDFQGERVIDFNSIKAEVTEDYKLMATKNLANEFVNKVLTELNAGEEFRKISNNFDSKLESYKGLKRDSSLLTSEAIVNIFNLPRSKVGDAYGTSVLKNGDFLIYRLDSVNNNETQMDSETQKGFIDYLNEEKRLAEYSELLFAIQENSEVTRNN
tara:strand:+ start:278 stop:2152 length:1875 start_codon:yes stop_codon:yes gene_type:complete